MACKGTYVDIPRFGSLEVQVFNVRDDRSGLELGVRGVASFSTERGVVKVSGDIFRWAED